MNRSGAEPSSKDTRAAAAAVTTSGGGRHTRSRNPATGKARGGSAKQPAKEAKEAKGEGKDEEPAERKKDEEKDGPDERRVGEAKEEAGTDEVDYEPQAGTIDTQEDGEEEDADPDTPHQAMQHMMARLLGVRPGRSNTEWEYPPELGPYLFSGASLRTDTPESELGRIRRALTVAVADEAAAAAGDSSDCGNCLVCADSYKTALRTRNRSCRRRPCLAVTDPAHEWYGAVVRVDSIRAAVTPDPAIRARRGLAVALRSLRAREPGRFTYRAALELHNSVCSGRRKAPVRSSPSATSTLSSLLSSSSSSSSSSLSAVPTAAAPIAASSAHPATADGPTSVARAAAASVPSPFPSSSSFKSRRTISVRDALVLAARDETGAGRKDPGVRQEPYDFCIGRGSNAGVPVRIERLTVVATVVGAYPGRRVHGRRAFKILRVGDVLPLPSATLELGCLSALGCWRHEAGRDVVNKVKHELGRRVQQLYGDLDIVVSAKHRKKIAQAVSTVPSAPSSSSSSSSSSSTSVASAPACKPGGSKRKTAVSTESVRSVPDGGRRTHAKRVRVMLGGTPVDLEAKTEGGGGEVADVAGDARAAEPSPRPPSPRGYPRGHAPAPRRSDTSRRTP